MVDEAIDSLAAGGATVVLLTSADFERSDTISAREWTQNETWRTQHINQLFREAAARHPSAVVIELGDWLCPDGCITHLADGRLAREDGIHFTDEGAETAARWLAPQLRSIGLAVNDRLPTADRAEPRASLRVEEELGEPARDSGDPEPQPPDLGPEPTSRSES